MNGQTVGSDAGHVVSKRVVARVADRARVVHLEHREHVVDARLGERGALCPAFMRCASRAPAAVTKITVVRLIVRTNMTRTARTSATPSSSRRRRRQAAPQAAIVLRLREHVTRVVYGGRRRLTNRSSRSHPPWWAGGPRAFVAGRVSHTSVMATGLGVGGDIEQALDGVGVPSYVSTRPESSGGSMRRPSGFSATFAAALHLRRRARGHPPRPRPVRSEGARHRRGHGCDERSGLDRRRAGAGGDQLGAAQGR